MKKRSCIVVGATALGGEMGIFGRMKTLLKANINDLASKAENPERVLTQLIADMEDQLRAAKLEVRDAITDRKQLEKQLEKARNKAADWEKKAMRAVEAGRDDLAREALQRKHQYEEQAVQHQIGVEQQDVAVEKLRNALRGLHKKIEEAKKKKSVMIARLRKAETQRDMHSTGDLAGGSAFDSFERNAAKIEQMEAEVAAGAEVDDALQEQELEAKFTGLEGGAGGGDDELAALKKKMGYED